jgi:hypothetical protein
LAVSDLRESRSYWSRSQGSSSARIGLDRACRAARRSPAGLPATSRSTSNSRSMRRTASAATGAFEVAASSYSFLRA